MEKDINEQKNGKPKSFFARFIEKLDKKMEDKVKKTKCCGASNDSKKGSCCN